MTAHPITAAQPPIAICGGRGTVQAIPLGSDNVGWIVACAATGEAALVDGPEAGPYLEALAARGLRLAALWTTHTHGDHIGLHRDLERQNRLQGVRVVACAPRAAEVPGANVLVDDGDVVTLGALEADVWRLEGHLRDHIGFVMRADAEETGAVLCGDTMFGAGCGYLFDGPADAMHASLNRIASLPASTLLCCAHEYTWDNLRFALSIDPTHAPLRQRVITSRAALDAGIGTLPSSIGRERETNPFLRVSDSNVIHVLHSETNLPLDATPAQRFAALRRLKDLRRYQERVSCVEMVKMCADEANRL